MPKIISKQKIITSCKKLYPSVIEDIFKSKKLKNKLMVPRVKVIHITAGLGKDFKKDLESQRYVEALTLIGGQKAVLTKATKSVSAFSLREGDNNGVRVTLRGEKMYDFLDRLKSIYLARMPDFRGLKRESFNGKSFSMGISRAQNVFPEVVSIMNVYDFQFGLNINIVFDIDNTNLQVEVLEQLGLPFKN